jgi:hypothetical protein
LLLRAAVNRLPLLLLLLLLVAPPPPWPSAWAPADRG